MRRAVLAGVLTVGLAAGAAGLAARQSAATTPAASLREAAARTAAAPSMRFELTARIAQTTALRPYTLHVRGATSPTRTSVHLKVADVTDATGRRLTGPSADERTDGTFLYFRSTVTQQVAGPLWVRERLAGLSAGAAELKTLRRVSPAVILRVLRRARVTSVAGGGLVFHARVADADGVARAALRGLEGDTDYRGLRLTAWVGGDGRVSRVRLMGRTADGASTFRLVVRLHGFGRPVTVTPPAAGTFVDYDPGAVTL